MAELNPEKQMNARAIYADIIDLPHHQSATRPHMSLHDRAAQFSPFAALAGYEDMVTEEARQTGTMTALEDWEMDVLGRKLDRIAQITSKGEHPVLEITYFVPDEKKAGGEYVTKAEAVKRIDAANKKIVLMAESRIGHVNLTIDLDKVADLRGECVADLDI